MDLVKLHQFVLAYASNPAVLVDIEDIFSDMLDPDTALKSLHHGLMTYAEAFNEDMATGILLGINAAAASSAKGFDQIVANMKGVSNGSERTG